MTHETQEQLLAQKDEQIARLQQELKIHYQLEAEINQLLSRTIEALEDIAVPARPYVEEIKRLRKLCQRAADALEAARAFDFIAREVLDANGITNKLIAELREAGK
jgi:septal ring factor EnvC (AmiA/AmiB activator)